LLNPEAKVKFDATTRIDYERLRLEHADKTRVKKMLTLEQARANQLAIDWKSYDSPVPDFLGVRVVQTPGSARCAAGGNAVVSERGSSLFETSLEMLVEYIDWSPFFHAWELRGRYPAILEDEVVGQQARELFADAQ